jgi:hypothetical protein
MPHGPISAGNEQVVVVLYPHAVVGEEVVLALVSPDTDNPATKHEVVDATQNGVVVRRRHDGLPELVDEPLVDHCGHQPPVPEEIVPGDERTLLEVDHVHERMLHGLDRRFDLPVGGPALGDAGEARAGCDAVEPPFRSPVRQGRPHDQGGVAGHAEIQPHQLLLPVDLHAEPDGLAHPGLRVVGAEHAELLPVAVVREHLLVGEAQVLVGVDPDIVGRFVPQHGEETTRPLGVAVPVHVAPESRTTQRVILGLVEERDVEGAGPGRGVRRIPVGELVPLCLHHVAHAQPTTVVLHRHVDGGLIHGDLGDRLPVDGRRDLQLRQE